MGFTVRQTHVEACDHVLHHSSKVHTLVFHYELADSCWRPPQAWPPVRVSDLIPDRYHEHRVHIALHRLLGAVVECAVEGLHITAGFWMPAGKHPAHCALCAGAAGVRGEAVGDRDIAEECEEVRIARDSKGPALWVPHGARTDGSVWMRWVSY